MQVWRIPTTGGTAEPLTDGGYTAQADYAPDGTALVYQSHDGIGFGLYVLPVTRGTATRLPTGDENAGSPRWSPDGTRVAFLSGPAERRSLHVMPADGGGAIRLTDATGAVEGYDWLRDGSGLVYSFREGHANIWRAEIGGLLEAMRESGS